MIPLFAQEIEMGEQLETAWEKLEKKLGGWVDSIIVNLPNFLLAILIFGVSFFLSNYINKFILKVLQRTKMQRSIKVMIAKIVSIVVIIVGLVLALGIMNLNKVLTTMLAGAGVAGLAVGLALQGTLSNTFSGIMLSIVDYIKIGDWIDTNGYSGEVVEINLRNTTIEQGDNNLVFIPNKLVVEGNLKNYSSRPIARVILSCGVGYESDLKLVEEITVNTIKENFKDINTEVQFYYTEFGDSSINFEVRFWIRSRDQMTLNIAKGKAIVLIKAAFDEHNINIPFPIRTINFSNPMSLEKKD
ncbi:mechanosensitive ion channel protein [Neptunitalea chrysea]|uniref:Mechanosensitive ion channel protein n=1 Tax=Neptunitalea chrysea TaxID=1647581 RepID=A0A9W6B4C0_9FLAO|nr:mechanosensitive ion channel family protein [Neptunitalea chrysea]GLB51360.1 mechanosensitive ion channel protein [Neptunitalea chrysea]